MKWFDKLLKVLKTDRNTFLTYTFLLISIYIIVDRLVEFLLIVYTVVESNFLGSIKYIIGISFTVFAFFL